MYKEGVLNMKRRLIGIASSIALLSMMAVPAGAQFIVETQAQTTVEAVLQEFPDPTPEDLLEIRNALGTFPLRNGLPRYIHFLCQFLLGPSVFLSEANQLIRKNHFLKKWKSQQSPP